MHDHSPFMAPELTVALALVAGIFAQVLAQHMRIPGIVLLLITGVLLGPDVLAVVHPEVLGGSLKSLVGFAVAVILFEGAMNLDLDRLRRAGPAVQRLITVGSLVTAVGATMAAWLVMGWTFRLAALFGTLVIVTGPTVVTPLLRRLRVHKHVSTVLEAEGVLIDPIGAIIAFVALGVALTPDPALEVALFAPELALRLGVGTALGGAGGWLLSRVLRVEHLIPEGLTNVFTLCSVLAMYQLSEAVLHESGIAAVTAAGVVVRYCQTPVQREVLEFKEQLTVMLIGMLFVVLAADVRLADVTALGRPGLLTVGLLMFAVRPLGVALSAIGTDLSWREQVFMAWMGPRGIVAAAVASLFAIELDAAGVDGGQELRALVFLVIAVTVVTAGFTGGLVASGLGLRRPQDAGWVVLGAHALGRAVGHALQDHREDVLLVDVNPAECGVAEREGLRVLHGDALKDTTMGRMELDTRAGALAVTRNEEVNFLFARKARVEGKVPRSFAALQDDEVGVNREMLAQHGVGMLFGSEQNIDRWNGRLRAGTAQVERRAYQPPEEVRAFGGLPRDGSVVCMVVRHARGGVEIVSDQTVFRKGDVLSLIVPVEQHAEIDARLVEAGWVVVTTEERTESGRRTLTTEEV